MANANSGIVRGFAKTKEQMQALKDHGLPDRSIYLDGRGAETLENCLASFRERPGTLVIARDLRLVADTKRGVADFMARMELASVRVQDITHPADVTQAQLIQTANVAISGARYHGDKPRARKHGKEGGRAKGKAAADTRSTIAPGWLIDRIVDEAGIPWSIKLGLLDPHFTESTLRRHYGARAMAAKS